MSAVRDCEGLLSCPPFAYSLRYGFGWNACKFLPFRCCSGPTAVAYHNIPAGVAVLLRSSCPSAVVGGISPVVVYPVQRMLRGRDVAHVGKEALKRQPSLANGNTSPCPAFAGRPFPSAAAFHSRPRLMLRSARGSMSFIKVGDAAVSKASTTLCLACEEICRLNRQFCTTRTLAKPPSPTLGDTRVPLNSQPAEEDSGQIHAASSVKGLAKLNISISVFCHALTLAFDELLSSAVAKAKPTPAGGK